MQSEVGECQRMEMAFTRKSRSPSAASPTCGSSTTVSKKPKNEGGPSLLSVPEMSLLQVQADIRYNTIQIYGILLRTTDETKMNCPLDFLPPVQGGIKATYSHNALP